MQCDGCIRDLGDEVTGEPSFSLPGLAVYSRSLSWVYSM